MLSHSYSNALDVCECSRMVMVMNEWSRTFATNEVNIFVNSTILKPAFQVTNKTKPFPVVATIDVTIDIAPNTVFKGDSNTDMHVAQFSGIPLFQLYYVICDFSYVICDSSLSATF